VSYELEGTTVLVTGGAGLVGSHIVDLLVDEGVEEIRVLDNLVRGKMRNLRAAQMRRDIRFIEGDIRDTAVVSAAVAGCDYVFHQAAIRITLCAENPRECLAVMFDGSFNLFEAAVAAGVKKVVYASSASIYGNADMFPTPEDHHPYNNRTIYGAAKVANEGFARSFHAMYGLPSVGLRYFNVYGPRMDVTGVYTEVIVRWLDCVDRSEPPKVFGDGKGTLDFVYIRDVARANILALKSPQVDAVYNVASGIETSLLGLWAAIQDVTGAHHLAPEFHPPRQVSQLARRVADVSHARQDLGFEAEVGLNEGLARLIDWRHEVLAEDAADAQPVRSS
jgi:UDP-glucose 4-epimerase